MILTEGILRARYRTSCTVSELLEPDAVYELRLDLWATANVFLPGHRIRLEVLSSNFCARVVREIALSVNAERGGTAKPLVASGCANRFPTGNGGRLEAMSTHRSYVR